MLLSISVCVRGGNWVETERILKENGHHGTHPKLLARYQLAIVVMFLNFLSLCAREIDLVYSS